MIITFTNVIGAIRTAFSVVRSGLKMWLGFETSETLGREEVVNGDFSNDTTSWSEEGSSTISVGTHQGKTDVANINILDTSTSSRITQSFDFVNGQTYEISVEVYLVSGRFRVDSANSFVPVNFVSTSTTGSWQTLNGTFTAIQTGTSDILLRGISDVSQFYVNSISIKELTQITPDKSGNNNVGELFTGKALEFDGSTDYVEVPNSTSLNVGTDDFTYCFWVYIGSAKAQRIIDKRNTKGFTFYLDASNVLRLELNDGTGFAAFILGTLTPSVWQRVVVSADRDGNAICYINGVAQTPVDISSKSGDLTDITSLFIGADAPSGETLFFDGFITDIQWYNTILSQSDVTYDYANPNKLAIDNPSTSLNVTNLKAYWALSEGDGLVAYDSGTNLEEEEVVDGNFPLPNVNWIVGDKWTIANNAARLVSNNNDSSFLQQNSVFEIGKTYNLTFDATVVSGTAKFIDASGGTKLEINQTKTYNFTFEADRTDFRINRKSTISDITISNISVREVTASDHGGNINGADYVLNQPRIPQLGMQNWSKGSNSLTFSEDFSNTVWTKGDGTSVTNGFTDPLGGNTAYKVSYNGTGTGPYIFDDANNTSNMRSVWARTVSGTGQIHLTSHSSNSNSLFNLTTEWQRVSAIPISSAGVANFYLADFRGSTDLTEVLVWGAQIDDGTTLGAYRLTDGGATLNSTVIPNPTIPTQDIFGNLVRDRLNSFNLDGSGYAEVADADSLNMSSGFSTSFWVKLDEGSTTTDYDFLVCKGRGISAFNATYGFGTTYYNNQLIATIYTSAAKNQLAYSNQNATGQWVFICVTFEPNTTNGFILYIDKLTPISMTTSGTVDESHNLNVGRDSSFVTTRQSKNIISDVLFYDSVLTSDEVENNYNAGLSAHTN